MSSASLTPDAARARRRRRGGLIHRLLQSIPDVPVERRELAALAYLDQVARDMPHAERATLARDVMATVEDARLAPLFAPGTIAEAPIVGELRRRDGALASVSGQIDRIAVTDDRIWLAEFKTAIVARGAADEVTDAVIGQIALYDALVAAIYPNRPRTAILVWTAGPIIMPLPRERLDAALDAMGLTKPDVTPA